MVSDITRIWTNTSSEDTIFMIFENQHPDKMMEFIARGDVTACRLEAGVKIETQEMISDLKRVWVPKS